MKQPIKLFNLTNNTSYKLKIKDDRQQSIINKVYYFSTMFSGYINRFLHRKN